MVFIPTYTFTPPFISLVILVLLDKWQCIQYNQGCPIYSGLWRKLSACHKI